MSICLGEEPWTVVPYISAAGNCPAREFLENQRCVQLDDYLFFRNVVEPLIRRYGPAVGLPHWKGVYGILGEIRWHEHRMYCAVESSRRLIVLLHGVTKKWPRFRPRDREICRARLTDLQSANYDGPARKALLRDKINRHRLKDTAQ